jgi:hypothetical protein
MRSLPTSQAVWPGIESLQPITGTGSRGRDNDLRYRTGSTSKPQRPLPFLGLALMKQVCSPNAHHGACSDGGPYFCAPIALTSIPCSNCRNETRFVWTCWLRHTGRGCGPYGAL